MPDLKQAQQPTTQTNAPDMGLLWLALTAAYLTASASGYRAVAMATIGLMAGALIAARGRRWAGLITGVALAAACLRWSDAIPLLLYFPPLFAFAFLSWFFYRTLAPGIEPLITRVARREHPDDMTMEMVQFTRLLTAAWSLCFAVLFLVALSIAPLLPPDTWSRAVFALGYFVPMALFLGEYIYRHRRFPDRSHGSLRLLVGNIIAVVKEAATEPARQTRGAREEA